MRLLAKRFNTKLVCLTTNCYSSCYTSFQIGYSFFEIDTSNDICQFTNNAPPQ